MITHIPECQIPKKCSQKTCTRQAQEGRKMCRTCADKMRERNRRYRSSETKTEEEATVIHCERCGNPTTETIKPTDNRIGEPPMNLHTYTCHNPQCLPGTGTRKIFDRLVEDKYPDHRVRIVMRLPRTMGQCEDKLRKKWADWDDPLGELDWDNLRGAGREE
jgi:hypothetical protein